jgi:hypothetical protein
MRDELEKQRAKDWVRQQLAFERMLEALRSNAAGTSAYWEPSREPRDRAA